MVDLQTLQSVSTADLAPLLSSALDHVCEFVHLLDREGRIVYVNAEGCKRLGYRRDELLAMTVFDIDPELTPAGWRDYLHCSAGFGRFERTHLCKDGSTYPVDVVAGPVEHEGVVYRLALSRDLGERRLAEQREQARLQLYDSLAGGRSLDEVLALVARYVERGAQRRCGVTVSLLEADGRLRVAAECGVPARASNASWTEPIHDSAGNPLGVVRMYRHEPGALSEHDLELARSACQLASIAIERMRLEAALRESERQFRTLAENLPDMVVRYDREGRRIYVNPAFERATGVLANDAVGTPVGSLWAGCATEPYRDELRRIIEHGGSTEWVCSRAGRDGRGRVHLAVRAVAEYGADGRPVGALAIGHDITEQKEAERRLRVSHDELRELAARSERAREQERRRIAHEIHDELGQLLTALRMSISALALQPGAQAPAIDEQVQRMLGLTDRTLQVVRGVVSTLRPAALDLGLVSALEWLAADFRRHTGIVCRLHAPCAPIEVGDERATTVFRIVQESLTNVARHAGADAVDIRLERDASHYHVEVRDDGHGFDAGMTRPRSFGLIGMRERALMVDGELTIDSAPGRSTTVRLRMPALAS